MDFLAQGGVSSQAKGSTSFLEEVLVPLACEDGGSLQNCTILVGYFFTFLDFLRSWYRMTIYFGTAQFQIFSGYA